MALSPTEIRGLLGWIGLTRESEIDCDQCLDKVAEFAERELTGRTIPESLESVSHHLQLCADCREEYEALQRALQGLGEPDPQG